nr:hypothetical protein [Agromyces seonyuensis]
MAGILLESDPELAHEHALAASQRAGRVAVVREALAVTAYQTGDFALALREARTYRRISGKDDQLPLMVDSERGLGRPDRALELGRSVDAAKLEPAVRAALAIAMSGARLDLGQTERALAELEIPQLDPDRAFSYSPDLFAAYATVLEDLGRTDDAAVWYARAERAENALDDAAADFEIVDIIDTIDHDLARDVEDEERRAAAAAEAERLAAEDAAFEAEIAAAEAAQAAERGEAVPADESDAAAPTVHSSDEVDDADDAADDAPASGMALAVEAEADEVAAADEAAAEAVAAEASVDDEALRADAAVYDPEDELAELLEDDDTDTDESGEAAGGPVREG